MSEKVIHEFQIIETDEGFRIELKGDKDMLRRMLFEGGRPFGMPFRWARRFGRHRPFEGEHHEHHEHPHPPFGFHAPRHGEGRRLWKMKRGYDLGPWWDEGAAPDEEASANV